MLTVNQWGAIDEYLKLDMSLSEIARRVGVSKPTVYKRIKVLKQEKDTADEDSTETRSELSKYEPYIKRAIKRHITSSTVIHSILQEVGCIHSYDTTNRLVKEVKARMKKHYKPSMRRDTDPGQEAQVDWGYYGEALVNGKKRRVWIFVYILGYSRCMYVEFTVNQNRKTLKQCHINAFKKLGVPGAVVYDNMKTVVKERIKKEIKISPEFLDFAHCLGFEVVVCAPNHPRSKGKVENTVKFVKKNFIPRLRYHYKRKHRITLEILNQEIAKWVKEQHERIQHETHQKPNTLWIEEKQYLHFPDPTKLTPLLTSMETRKVSKDGYIFYKDTKPFQLSREYIEESVDIKETNEHGLVYIEIYFKNKVIAKFLLTDDYDHVNLLSQEEKDEKKKSNMIKTLHPSQEKQVSMIPLGGFYRPDGYYDKLTTYNGGTLWAKKQHLK